jgi:8-oxo-dGTP pyrophosphatase MutT (NUDIX family)
MPINNELPEITSLTSESDIKAKLKQELAKRPKKIIKDDSRRESAVLIPIFYEHGQFYILFTKRTELVHHHKGEISFPGGGFHPDDGSLIQTALRESQEEIGLEPSDVEVLGALDDIITRGSPFIISPFVGAIRAGYLYKPSVFEIAEIITVPIRSLLKMDCHAESPEIMPDGQHVTAHVFSYGSYRIVGATARILKQFLEIYSVSDCAGPG